MRTRGAEPFTVLVLYHYLYPDDVVSSSHFTELATGLAAAGWRVIASSSNRACRGNLPPFEKRSFWNGVLFRRVWRPPLRQASGLGRVLNIMWMIAAWSLLALNRRLQPDVLIVGTDPILSPVVATIWKRLRPKTRLVHWCFDLYPEAAVSDGLLQERSLIVRLCKHLMGRAYRSFGLIVDIGSCMRERLQTYDSRALMETITPWALAEPVTAAPVPATERNELFGDANLCLLYSGSFGRAHTWQGLLEIAEAIYPSGGRVVFSVRGNSVAELRKALNHARVPIRLVDLAAPDKLDMRLSSADIHIVSLRDEWTGTVVPSKFFGALAMGRPVLFVGSSDSAIARWIQELKVGWVLDHSRVENVARDLIRWSQCPAEKIRLFQHCHEVYQREFSRRRSIDRWDDSLRRLLSFPLSK